MSEINNTIKTHLAKSLELITDFEKEMLAAIKVAEANKLKKFEDTKDEEIAKLVSKLEKYINRLS